LAKVFKSNSNNNKKNPRVPFRGQKQPEHRINEFIKVPEARLVGDNLEQLSEIVGETIEPAIYPVRKLLDWSTKVELDLIEVVPNAEPPVVRITDYNKFLYLKKKKEKEIKANSSKVEVKEIRFGPSTETHDFEFKLRHATKFLQEGAKVRAYVQFKGREIVFKDKGELLLLNFLKELMEFGQPEGEPKLEGKRMFVTIAPKKKK
jgi:translation initiation factor IF-3